MYDVEYTTTTQVLQEMNPMVMPLYHIGQFLGFVGSSSPSQSTSKSGLLVPVVPTEVALRDNGGLVETRESWGVKGFSGSSGPCTEAISRFEFLEDERDDRRPDLGDSFSISEDAIALKCDKTAQQEGSYDTMLAAKLLQVLFFHYAAAYKYTKTVRTGLQVTLVGMEVKLRASYLQVMTNITV